MLGAAIAAVCADPAVLARIGGVLGDDARVSAASFAAGPPDDRRARRAAAIAAVRAPLPAGLRGVDPSWIEAGLAGLPTRARDGVALPRPDRISVWLARWACADVPPMPPVDPARHQPRSARDLAGLGAVALEHWLSEVGADQLAFGLGARAVGVGTGFGDVVERAARRISIAPRVGQLGARRRAIACARVEPGPTALLTIGARAIGPHLDAITRRQLACRLARPHGRDLERALAALAYDPVADAPTWNALAATVEPRGNLDDR